MGSFLDSRFLTLLFASGRAATLKIGSGPLGRPTSPGIGAPNLKIYKWSNHPGYYRNQNSAGQPYRGRRPVQG